MMSKAEENMKRDIEKILEERRKDVKVVKHDVPYDFRTMMSVYEVQYAVHSYDAVGHRSTSWYSYGIFGDIVLANYIAESIARGVINIKKD